MRTYARPTHSEVPEMVSFLRAYRNVGEFSFGYEVGSMTRRNADLEFTILACRGSIFK